MAKKRSFLSRGDDAADDAADDVVEDVVEEKTEAAAVAPAEATEEVALTADAPEAPVKVGDIVSTKFGRCRVRKVFNNGDVYIITKPGHAKRVSLG
jgi:hypothetical protein